MNSKDYIKKFIDSLWEILTLSEQKKSRIYPSNVFWYDQSGPEIYNFNIIHIIYTVDIFRLEIVPYFFCKTKNNQNIDNINFTEKKYYKLNIYTDI